jgi:hypothetical protein
MANSAIQVDDPFLSNGVFLKTNKQEVLKVLSVGAIVGLGTPFIAFLLEKFFITPVFCNSPDAFNVCASGGLTSWYAATVILSIMALITLANWQVFRPLLIVVATAAALWGFKKFTTNLSIESGFEYYLYALLITMASYGLFYWVMRLKSFASSVVITVLLVALIRWVLIA